MKKNKKGLRTIIGVIIVILMGMSFLILSQVRKEQNKSSSHTITKVSTDTKSAKNHEKHIYIHICGYVKKPDVYSFDYEPRLNEVVQKAGGFRKKADRDSLNLAEVIQDGMRIEIPARSTKQKAKTSDGSQTTVADKEEKINLNTATKEELMTLTGVGESKANAIVGFREERGRFQKIEDIMKISGIKDGVFQKVKHRLCV